MRLVGCGRGDGAGHAENGTPTKVLMDANRNGFFYVIDRTNGKLLAANPYVKVNWAVRSRLKDLGAHYKAVAAEYKAGEWYIDLDLSNLWEWLDGPRGYLKAIEPLSGKAKWEAPSDLPRFSGVLSTGGGDARPVRLRRRDLSRGPPEDPPAEKGSYPRESRRVERTLLLRFKLCTRHHVANRGRVPLPAARRVDPAGVQGLGDLPQ
jgi:hypothetical protein